MPRQHCTNFPDIAQGSNGANFEQKDKIVWNSHTETKEISIYILKQKKLSNFNRTL